MTFLLDTFQTFRRVLCVCPNCNEIVRLSDLHLRYKGTVQKTWLDSFQTKQNALATKEEKFEEKEQKLRDEATERGRKKVPSLIKNSMSSEFTSLKYNPYDIKAILHPVDFVVFDGLNEQPKLSEVVFLSKKAGNDYLNKIRKSINTAIEEKAYDWQVARVSADGKVEFETG